MVSWDTKLFKKVCKTLSPLASYILNVRSLISFSSHIRNSHQRCSIKKTCLKILQNSQENTCIRVSFLIKLQTFKNTFFTEHLWTTASEIWKAPIFPNLQTGASALIFGKPDSCTNVSVR